MPRNQSRRLSRRVGAENSVAGKHCLLNLSNGLAIGVGFAIGGEKPAVTLRESAATFHRAAVHLPKTAASFRKVAVTLRPAAVTFEKVTVTLRPVAVTFAKGAITSRPAAVGYARFLSKNGCFP
jgi:nucleoside 2-deoxyribosyltransferase